MPSREASNGSSSLSGRRPSPRQRPPTAPDPSLSNSTNGGSGGGAAPVNISDPSASERAAAPSSAPPTTSTSTGPPAMPPLRVNAAALGEAPAGAMAGGPNRSVLNGRTGGGGASALRNGAGLPRGSSPSRGSSEGVDILAVLKQAARQEPAAALRELQRLHSQLTGAAGSKALGSLESAWQQQASDDPSGAPGTAAGGGSGGGGGGGGGSRPNVGAGGNSATANAITAQQRELNQLTIQRQRLQQQQREQRNELHSVTSELEKRKNELRQVSDQLKQRRSMMKGSGSPRAPTPPRGSPGGAQSPGGQDGSSTDRAGAPSAAEPIVPKLQVGGQGGGGGGGAAAAKAPGAAAPSPSSPGRAAASAPSSAGASSTSNGNKGEAPAAPRGKEGGAANGGANGAPAATEDGESAAERLEGLQEELEDARGDLQLTISDLRVILEATPAFVCAVDPHGHVSGWNTAAIEITGLRRDGVLQRHFVEHFVPTQHQQAAADAMEAAFSMAADDPLAGEPGEPFDLTLWRGSGGSERASTVTIKVRAYARRLSGGQPVGLLLIQDDAGSNEAMRDRTNAEREVVELQQVIGMREQELEEHEAELASLRSELQAFYEERAAREGKTLSAAYKPGHSKATPVPILSKGAAAGQPGSGQRIQWGKPNHVGHFTKGSSPREFGNKNRHEQIREQVLGPDKLTGGTQQTPAVQPTR
jgi:PAS domain-containing protein